jgi:hypothetical protein
MPRRTSGKSTSKMSSASWPADRLHTGQIRKQNVLDPVRSAHTTQGVYRPSNQWRSKSAPSSSSTDVRQRALLLAKQLPWLPQYNFARG